MRWAVLLATSRALSAAAMTATSKVVEPRALRHVASAEAPLPCGLLEREHTLTCPLDWTAAAGSGSTIDVYVREVSLAKNAGKELPLLLYLQGGPGFGSPRPTAPPTGWMKKALDDFRVLLLDQRGTGRSTPVTPEGVRALGPPEAQAAYLACLRADSIVRDCEAVRAAVGGANAKLTLLGQSFGGFCILTYLSLYPGSLERALVTFGLAPVGQPALEVYRHTFERMTERNRRFYQKYPGDVRKVRAVLRALAAEPAPMAGGGVLTPRRFLQLGLLLGSASGFEALHYLLEAPFEGGLAAPADPARPRLSKQFVTACERQQPFEGAPIFWILHELIYADGEHQPTAWAASRAHAELAGGPFDFAAVLGNEDEDGAPAYFSGEMVYPWMAEDYAELRGLGEAAELLASKRDWPRLYDESVLRDTKVPVAALIAYDDIYVERAYSERVVRLLGERASVWCTNEFAHSGLRDDPSVFTKLLEMSKGESAIPA